MLNEGSFGLIMSNISPTSGPNGLKFRYVVALEQSFPMSIKSKRSGGNLQYLVSYQCMNTYFINLLYIFIEQYNNISCNELSEKFTKFLNVVVDTVT
ncbi:hypothetical protein BCR32DRAFT_278873 [Anaeromyces robustus]|uniref:Uncharacterized protein n=1 Tax=Anaeromyces robustus TaxID=1754192 RepID=A0A1Y1X9R1_9FUNG|nr:hypothetical protein BCR32DRAFT_278873 [Anaeromyces robustus]|eukprot:ORX82485.1 hypothetical protein BCR32DRAFT_278873 [Anaeromyces robustus]